MTTYAVVKASDEKTPFWLELVQRYLFHCQSYKAMNTIERVDKTSIASFTKYIGNPRIGKITGEAVEKFISHLRLEIAPSSLRTRLIALRLVFTFAIDCGLIAANPFSGIRLPPQAFAGRVLTDQEIATLLARMSDAMRRICITALYTGMRVAEILSLDWSQVMGDRIIIPASKAKSKRERIIMLHHAVQDVLGPSSQGRIFLLSYDQLQRAMTAAWQSAGIGRVRFHDFRHTAATRFMEVSDDVFALMDAFGWKSPASAAPYQHMTRTRQERILKIKYDL